MGAKIIGILILFILMVLDFINVRKQNKSGVGINGYSTKFTRLLPYLVSFFVYTFLIYLIII